MQIFVVILFITITDCKRRRHRPESVETNANRHQDAVDFGHVFRDPEKNLHLFEGGDKLNLENAYAMRDGNRDIAAKYMAPRERFLYERFRKIEEGEAVNNKTEANNEMSYNFEAMLDRNLARHQPQPLRKVLPPAEKPINTRHMKPLNISIHEIEERTFNLKETTDNWTTCDEFSKKALFHPDDIINLDWIPFYAWTLRDNDYALTHRFQYPSKKLVQRYKLKYGPFVKGIDWNEPKLLLNNTREVLLIAKNRSGLFQGVVNTELPESFNGLNLTLPIMNIRMKILDPFLALMYCDDRTSYIMAIVGEEPLTDTEKIKAASILRFRGKGKLVRLQGDDEKLLSNISYLSMFSLAVHFGLLSFVETTIMGPHMHLHEFTNCEEFGKFARFNLNSVLESEWMTFYYWGPTTSIMFIRFLIPSEKQIAYLHHLMDDHVSEPVNWTAPMVLLKEKNNVTHLLVEQGDRGQYILYTPYKGLKKGETVDMVNIRLKQVENGRYIGILMCESGLAYALTRVTDIPKKKNVQDEAAKMGYRGRKGKSYLYRGHEWMPIGEADYDEYLDKNNELYTNTYR